MACNYFSVIIFNVENFTNKNVRVLSTLSIFIATISSTLNKDGFPLAFFIFAL